MKGGYRQRENLGIVWHRQRERRMFFRGTNPRIRIAESNFEICLLDIVYTLHYNTPISALLCKR